MLIAYFAGNALLGDLKSKAVTVKTATAISKSITQPDDRIFKADAINTSTVGLIGEGSQPQTTQ